MSVKRTDVATLKNFSKALRKMGGVDFAQRVAQRVAPILTDKTQAAFNAKQTVYGDARPPGANGPVSLYKTGRLQRSLKFRAVGTWVRASLGVPYAQYLIRFGVLPRGGAKVPQSWIDTIVAISREELQQRMSA